MSDLHGPPDELRALELKRIALGLTPQEEARRAALASGAPSVKPPIPPPAPARGFDVTAAVAGVRALLEPELEPAAPAPPPPAFAPAVPLTFGPPLDLAPAAPAAEPTAPPAFTAPVLTFGPPLELSPTGPVATAAPAPPAGLELVPPAARAPDVAPADGAPDAPVAAPAETAAALALDAGPELAFSPATPTEPAVAPEPVPPGAARWGPADYGLDPNDPEARAWAEWYAAQGWDPATAWAYAQKVNAESEQAGAAPPQGGIRAEPDDGGWSLGPTVADWEAAPASASPAPAAPPLAPPLEIDEPELAAGDWQASAETPRPAAGRPGPFDLPPIDFQPVEDDPAPAPATPPASDAGPGPGPGDGDRDGDEILAEEVPVDGPALDAPAGTPAVGAPSWTLQHALPPHDGAVDVAAFEAAPLGQPRAAGEDTAAWDLAPRPGPGVEQPWPVEPMTSGELVELEPLPGAEPAAAEPAAEPRAPRALEDALPLQLSPLELEPAPAAPPEAPAAEVEPAPIGEPPPAEAPEAVPLLDEDLVELVDDAQLVDVAGAAESPPTGGPAPGDVLLGQGLQDLDASPAPGVPAALPASGPLESLATLEPLGSAELLEPTEAPGVAAELPPADVPPPEAAVDSTWGMPAPLDTPATAQPAVPDFFAPPEAEPPQVRIGPVLGPPPADRSPSPEPAPRAALPQPFEPEPTLLHHMAPPPPPEPAPGSAALAGPHQPEPTLLHAWTTPSEPGPAPGASPAPSPGAEPEPPPAPPAAPAPAEANVVAGSHRVVLHTTDGQVLRGVLTDAALDGVVLLLAERTGAQPSAVSTDQVKAVFFMLEAGERALPPEGQRLRVTFRDGRQVAGFSPAYSPEHTGFFLVPADTRTRTARIWVYRNAVRQVSVG